MLGRFVGEFVRIGFDYDFWDLGKELFTVEAKLFVVWVMRKRKTLLN